MDNQLILLLLLAVLLLVNLIVSSVTLSKLNKNKDGYAYTTSGKKIIPLTTISGSSMTY